MATELAGDTVRLGNSPIWRKLPTAAQKLAGLLSGDPLETPSKLGTLYPLVLQLGQFLETDARVQKDPLSSDGPLAPEIHGPLTTLVRTVAPWLRGFPTIAVQDDEAGKMLIRADLFQSARDFTRTAAAQKSITDPDAKELEILAEIAGEKGNLAEKASNRFVASAQNLQLAVASILAARLADPDAPGFAYDTPLVQRASATMARAEPADMRALAATRPDDLRYAIEAVTAESRRQTLIRLGSVSV